MTPDPQVPKERAIVEVSPETKALVEKNMTEESDDVQQQTMELIETIKRKAQSEAQKAGELTRDTYLEAVRQVQKEVENTNLFDPERITESIQLMQQDAEKNWDSLVTEVSNFGDRLSEAARVAWETLTEPRPKS